MVKRLVMILGWLVFVGALTFAVVRFSGLLDSMLLPMEPLEDPDLGPDLVLPDDPVYYLICAPDDCPQTDRRSDSPHFDVAPDTLAFALRDTALSQDMMLDSFDTLSLRMRFLARTPVFRFPDWIDVQVLSDGAGGSRIFAFSRSVYGRGDFGENRERLLAWIMATRARLDRTESLPSAGALR